MDLTPPLYGMPTIDLVLIAPTSPTDVQSTKPFCVKPQGQHLSVQQRLSWHQEKPCHCEKGSVARRLRMAAQQIPMRYAVGAESNKTTYSQLDRFIFMPPILTNKADQSSVASRPYATQWTIRSSYASTPSPKTAQETGARCRSRVWDDRLGDHGARCGSSRTLMRSKRRWEPRSG